MASVSFLNVVFFKQSMKCSFLFLPGLHAALHQHPAIQRGRVAHLRGVFFSIFLRNNLENFLEQDSIVLQSVFTNARERLEQVDDEEEEEELF